MSSQPRQIETTSQAQRALAQRGTDTLTSVVKYRRVGLTRCRHRAAPRSMAKKKRTFIMIIFHTPTQHGREKRTFILIIFHTPTPHPPPSPVSPKIRTYRLLLSSFSGPSHRSSFRHQKPSTYETCCPHSLIEILPKGSTRDSPCFATLCPTYIMIYTFLARVLAQHILLLKFNGLSGRVSSHTRSTLVKEKKSAPKNDNLGNKDLFETNCTTIRVAHVNNVNQRVSGASYKRPLRMRPPMDEKRKRKENQDRPPHATTSGARSVVVVAEGCWRELE